MGLEEAKDITIAVHGVQFRYKVYEQGGAIYYFNSRLDNPIHRQLTHNTLTPEEINWVKVAANTQGKNKLLASVSVKIAQDKERQDTELTDKIHKNYEAMTMRQAAAVLKDENRLRRTQRGKGILQSELDDASASRRTPSTPLDDESMHSSASSVATNPSAGSYVEPREDNSSGTRGRSASSKLTSTAPASGSSRRPTTILGSRHDDMIGSDPWSGRNVSFSRDREDDVLLDLSDNEFPQHTATEGTPPSPTLPTDDLNALYRDLQAIVDILAQLKGNEPQLENVREALNAAIEETGGKVSPRTEATVEPPNAGVAGTVTNPAPKADDIEANIQLLKEVQGKLAYLLSTHGDTMGDELRDALVELQKVVEQSISAQTTQKFRGDMNAAVQSEQQHIPKTPLSGSTPVADDDMSDDSSSTPSV